MSDPKKHHHVPQFFLAAWCRRDGKLAVYSRKRNHVVIDWHAPEYTAFEPHLYSISALPIEDRQWVEREVMTKAVDDPAARVLRRLVAGELSAFDSDARSDWTRFILAQWMRGPEQIAKLRREGRAAMLQSFESNPEEFLDAKDDSQYQSLTEWADANAPGLDEIVAMGRVLPRLITDTESGNIIINMRWEVIQLTDTKIDLLTSDQPVVRIEGLKMKDCMIVIPLSPRSLFIASHRDRRFSQFAPEKIARATNKTMVATAKVRLYGTGTHHKPLVEKWLSRRSETEG